MISFVQAKFDLANPLKEKKTLKQFNTIYFTKQYNLKLPCGGFDHQEPSKSCFGLVVHFDGYKSVS